MSFHGADFGLIDQHTISEYIADNVGEISVNQNSLSLINKLFREVNTTSYNRMG